jgi:hypothetical protein
VLVSGEELKEAVKAFEINSEDATSSILSACIISNFGCYLLIG